MNKLLSLLFLGPILAMVPLFFLFIGMKIHYFDLYEIKEFYNIIFVDTVSWPLFWLLAVILGALFVFPKKHLMSSLLLGVLFTASIVPVVIPTVGRELGTRYFAKPKRHIKAGAFLYSGTVLYEGRKNIYLYSDEHNRTLTFNKEQIHETY